jgi:hypothetical protein
MGRFMKYAVGMGSATTIYTKFHKDLFRDLKFDKGNTNTKIGWSRHKALFLG